MHKKMCNFGILFLKFELGNTENKKRWNLQLTPQQVMLCNFTVDLSCYCFTSLSHSLLAEKNQIIQVMLAFRHVSWSNPFWVSSFFTSDYTTLFLCKFVSPYPPRSPFASLPSLHSLFGLLNL